MSSNYAYSSDSDGNGIEDSYEAGLVEKFMPCIQLDSNDNGVSPKPIEIIGAQTINNMYIRVFVAATGQFVGEWRNYELNLFNYQQLDDLNTDYYQFNFDPPGAHGYGAYLCVPHWEWGSTSSNDPSSWLSTYNSVKDNYD